MRILLAGPGLMGSQIAVEYALAGHDVTVLARDSAKASQRLASAWQTAEGMERWPDDAFETGGRNLVIASELETVDPPDLALESIVEDGAAKGELLRALATRFPKAILASNTSSISIGTLG